MPFTATKVLVLCALSLCQVTANEASHDVVPEPAWEQSIDASLAKAKAWVHEPTANALSVADPTPVAKAPQKQAPTTPHKSPLGWKAQLRTALHKEQAWVHPKQAKKQRQLQKKKAKKKQQIAAIAALNAAMHPKATAKAKAAAKAAKLKQEAARRAARRAAKLALQRQLKDKAAKEAAAKKASRQSDTAQRAMKAAAAHRAASAKKLADAVASHKRATVAAKQAIRSYQGDIDQLAALRKKLDPAALLGMGISKLQSNDMARDFKLARQNAATNRVLKLKGQAPHGGSGSERSQKRLEKLLHTADGAVSEDPAARAAVAVEADWRVQSKSPPAKQAKAKKEKKTQQAKKAKKSKKQPVQVPESKPGKASKTGQLMAAGYTREEAQEVVNKSPEAREAMNLVKAGYTAAEAGRTAGLATSEVRAATQAARLKAAGYTTNEAEGLVDTVTHPAAHPAAPELVGEGVVQRTRPAPHKKLSAQEAQQLRTLVKSGYTRGDALDLIAQGKAAKRHRAEARKRAKQAKKQAQLDYMDKLSERVKALERKRREKKVAQADDIVNLNHAMKVQGYTPASR